MRMLGSVWPAIVIVAAVVVLGVTGNLFATSPFLLAAQVAAIGLNVWARRSFPKGTFRIGAAPAGEAVIRRGPYRFIRHPIYASALVLVWAAVIDHLSMLTVAVGVVVTCAGIGRIIAEERLLLKQYPDYADYARGTKRLAPFLF